METIPFLTKEDVLTLDGLLGDYLQKSNADVTLVIDKGGTIVAQQGDAKAADPMIIAALAAGSFAATKELARRIGESEFSALYHQGKTQHIFMSALDEHSIIVTIFGEKTTVGLIRFYTIDVTAQLASFLKKLRSREDNGQLPFALEVNSNENVPAHKIFV
jgi:predicted regulator of Ras-like GTPase activity (Roadblock/LC7/MglB family)